MSDLLKDIGAFLVSNGIYTKVGTDVVLDSKPDSPDKVCCLFEYPGSPPDPGAEYLDRRVQILTRDTSYSSAKAKAWAIYNLLDKPGNPEDIIQLSDARIAVFSAIQSPFKLEEDSKKRIVFICNYVVTTERD